MKEVFGIRYLTNTRINTRIGIEFNLRATKEQDKFSLLLFLMLKSQMEKNFNMNQSKHY